MRAIRYIGAHRNAGYGYSFWERLRREAAFLVGLRWGFTRLGYLLDFDRDRYLDELLVDELELEVDPELYDPEFVDWYLAELEAEPPPAARPPWIEDGGRGVSPRGAELDRWPGES